MTALQISRFLVQLMAALGEIIRQLLGHLGA
jgi:hypothetical protein